MALRSWPRPHWKPGGGDAFLMYQVFGDFEGDFEVDQETHRSQGLPEGVQFTRYERNEHPDEFAWFKGLHLWQDLVSKEPDLAEAVDAATGSLRIQGSVKDPPTLDYFRDAVGLVTAAFHNGGAVVFDPQMFKWWSPAEWMARAFDPDGPVPRHHVVILTSEDDRPGLEWFHTRGLRKFGRPDLSIRFVASEHREAVIDLCNRFIEFQAFGGQIAEGQPIRMASLPAGLTCRHGGDLEDPDFNNLHVEIRWP